jgi:hypothetical protein
MGFGSRHGKAPLPDLRFRLAMMRGRGLVTAFFALFHQRQGAAIGRLILAGVVAIGTIEETRTRGRRIGAGKFAGFLFPIARSAAYFCGRKPAPAKTGGVPRL